MNIRKSIGEKIFKAGVRQTVDEISRFLPKRGTILDLGAGTCLFTQLLQKKGYKVKPVDIRNRSYYPDIAPQVYNGTKLPFDDNAFAACMLIAVLHHTKDPKAVLKEAARVSKRLVIYEDVVTNPLQRWYTYCIDSLLNKEFFGHPHSNKTEAEWLRIFKKLDLQVIKVTHRKSWLFLQNPIYFLEKA